MVHRFEFINIINLLINLKVIFEATASHMLEFLILVHPKRSLPLYSNFLTLNSADIRLV